MAKNTPRHKLKNEMAKMTLALKRVQEASVMFDTIVKRHGQVGDNTERLLSTFAKSMFEQAEFLSTLVSDVQDRL